MLVVYSPHQRSHRPAQFVVAGQLRAHPDVPERLDSLLTGIADGHELIEPADHGLRYVGLVHTARYLEFLQVAHEQWHTITNAADTIIPNVHPRRTDRTYPRSIVGRTGFHVYDLSCPINHETWHAVLWNAHSATEAALQVASGKRMAAYALCRPPGHHAGPDYAGGFCYLNNSAIAAAVLREKFSRVAVLDVDVHHGNGTQDIFYDRDDVLVISLHGDPRDFYPFYWGHADETGAGPGKGANCNIPLPRGLADEDYLVQLSRAIERIGTWHAQALVVPLGFDTYEHDPLAWLKITTNGFARIAAAIAALGLPTVLVQEGGYLCRDLGRNLAAFLHGFAISR